MVVQERHLWLNLAEMKDVDKARFFDAPISRQGCSATPSRALPSSFSAIQQQTEAIQHTCPGVMHHPPLPPGPGLSPPVAVGTLLRPPELLAPRPNRYLGRRVEPPRRRVAPPASQSGPKSSRKSTKSIVPLEPLAQRLEAWLTLPSLSRWLTHTIQLGYAIQFAKRPPKFNGILETPVAVRNAPVLREEIAVLLAKDAIEPVPPAKRRQGFYSPYFIVPKKRDDLRPILDLRVMNRALHKLPQDADTQAHYKMHPAPGLVCSDRPEGCLLHVSILLRHRPFRRFAFEGRA